MELRTGIWNPQSFTLKDESGGGHLLSLVLGMDGVSSSRALAKREGVSTVEVQAVIDHLQSVGALENGPSSALDAYLDTVSTLGRVGNPAEIADRVLLLGDPALTRQVSALLAEGELGVPVVVVPPEDPLWVRLTSLGGAELHDGLALARLVEEFEPWRRSFAVVADRIVEPLRMQSLNRIARRTEMAFLAGVLDGPCLFVGPTVMPNASACWECFETRMTMSLRESRSYLAYKNALSQGQVFRGEPPVLGALVAVLASHLALEAMNFLRTGAAFTLEKVLSVYLPTMEIAYGEVLRLPGCRGCAPVTERDDSSLAFDPRSWLDD
ncbi:MAG TPA: TOMM precursor leader peptide-binding protein [Kineosporiaceae bacterium]